MGKLDWIARALGCHGPSMASAWPESRCPDFKLTHYRKIQDRLPDRPSGSGRVQTRACEDFGERIQAGQPGRQTSAETPEREGVIAPMALLACIGAAACCFAALVILIRNGQQRHKSRLRAQNYRPRDAKGHFVKRGTLG